MYSLDLYNSFIQLRKQLYKIKTLKWQDKYSKIELNKAKYKTFLRFYDNAYEYCYIHDNFTIQDIFDDMLTKSQSKHWIKIYCF